MNNELPHRIGGYKIESFLGKGGMTVLYLGIHPETHEPIAIKVLSSKYVSHPEMVESFMREAEIIELTNHPNIVKLYGHGKWEGGVYIAMEFIQGISLRQMILQEAMSLKRALEVVIQIGHALTHLHAHGVIHRDLKPENVLLTAQGGVKVIDFGISQIYTEKITPSNIRVMGTPIYMSPEQRENPFNVDFSTDVYALGIITYELVLGRLSHGVVHLSNVPRGLQKILARALQPKPKERFDDIVEFIQEVSAYLTSDELRRDMRGSDYLGEFSERLREAQTLLVPRRLPEWRRVEMGFASNCSTALSSVYYDFFQPRDGVYSLVMGESLTTGVEGLLQVAMLKGMVRALAHAIDRPPDFVRTLNTRIFEEGNGQNFSFSLLTLYPSEERFSFISCGYSPLWSLPSGADSPRRLSADNLPLGVSASLEFLEIDSNWNIGDLLVLHTFQAGQSKNIREIELDEAHFLEALTENLFLNPKQQVEAIFRKVSQKEGRAFFERPVTVISLERES
ncbi:MAG: protein kinase [Chlamydiales bacterium]|nr:protein kinase [Chlamydiales bacterium]